MKKFNKYLSFILIFIILALSLKINASADKSWTDVEETRMYANGYLINFAELPIYQDGELFFDLNKIVEFMGYKCDGINILYRNNSYEVKNILTKNNKIFISKSELLEIQSAVFWAKFEFVTRNTNQNFLMRQELEKIIEEYGKGVSVYYKDLTSGEQFFYGTEEKYYIASVIKMPYVVYIYRKALSGELDLNRKLTYTSKYFVEGTGKIKNMSYGTQFSLHELIEYAIKYSDNCATKMLVSLFTTQDYINYAKSINLPHIEEIKLITNGTICAECAAVYLQNVYDFIHENNIYSQQFRQLLMSTGNKMIWADSPIARKYGWALDSFHDMAIIYNEKRPYLLAILSDRGMGDFAMFKKISLAVQNYNNYSQ